MAPRLSSVSLGALVAAFAGCGHPATKAECDEIFRRSAEIALKARKVTEQAEVDRYVADARAAKGQAMLDECVGKRVTDKAMQCVRRAESADQLDKCLQ